ncbi:unnamed protein product [Heligmosomoides polygyrus]|uniref:DM domain-containing protein n=1 Tax=Heligmosomoides polygyrus TaxID=6339 RepID=A0A183GEL1_HELPZ|nr:unnamed protein product [Heligmosomoides polygyrus]
MNIEDIVPELFGEKRVYYCQRCLNHGLREKRKNHKQNCAYSMCQCSDCIVSLDGVCSPQLKFGQVLLTYD